VPQLNSISIDELFRIIGTPGAPVIIDVRTDEAFGADPTLIPGTVRREAAAIATWAGALAGRSAVIACSHGAKLSRGAAAWLRQEGCDAEALEGGYEAWRKAALPLVPEARLPRRDADGRTHYRWCRDAVGETHNWELHAPRGKRA